MISIHHDHRLFIPCLQRFKQLTHKLIHFVYLVYIILKRLPCRFILDAGDLYFRIGVVRRQIFSVSLHRYGVNKIRSFGRIERVGDAAGQHLVLRPAGRRELLCVHIFYRGKGIEAQIFENYIPVVKHRGIVVYRVAFVPEALEILTYAVARVLF